MNQFTSFELSKKLGENGCELKSSKFFQSRMFFPKYYQYDILWDICIKYAKEFFGEKILSEEVRFNYEKTKIFQSSISQYTKTILTMIQNNIPQKEIENYIWENCLFNPKNKEA